MALRTNGTEPRSTMRTSQNGRQDRTKWWRHTCGLLVLGVLLFAFNGVIVKQVSPKFHQGTFVFHDFAVYAEQLNDNVEATRRTVALGGDKHAKHNGNDAAVKATTQQSPPVLTRDPLERSKRQQRKFDARKNLLKNVFDKSMLYNVDLYEFGANVVNDEWAYLHIFKNGGTTIEVQTGHDHTSIQDPQVQKRKWFTFVRDPIDHFLSGWAECAHREREEAVAAEKNQGAATFSMPIPYNTSVQESYDQRVNDWLDAVTALARPHIEAACEIHSFPQANSLLDAQGKLVPQLQLVGDLSELPNILTSIGFRYNPKIEAWRNSSASEYLNTYFPKRKEWLSVETMQRLCDFLAVDYFLFDFDMPKTCTNKVTRKKGVILKEIDSLLEEVGRELSQEAVETSRSILKRMENEDSLQLSRRQQAAFEARKAKIPKIFSKARRFKSNLGQWGANIINDNWAYLHVFKNGGTTIAAQTRRDHVPLSDREVLRRPLFTVVRDPLEHFLSGWSECGDRERKQRLRKLQEAHPDRKISHVRPPLRLTKVEYDTRIQEWLMRVRMHARSASWVCEVHSFPQVNSMLQLNGIISPRLVLVGDLKELPSVLKLVGFEYNHSIASGRNATSDSFLQTYYPRRVELLSNKTIRSLCDFLAIDYYLFDYPLPEACHDMPPSGYTNWTSHWTSDRKGAAASDPRIQQMFLDRHMRRAKTRPNGFHARPPPKKVN